MRLVIGIFSAALLLPVWPGVAAILELPALSPPVLPANGPGTTLDAEPDNILFMLKNYGTPMDRAVETMMEDRGFPKARNGQALFDIDLFGSVTAGPEEMARPLNVP